MVFVSWSLSGCGGSDKKSSEKKPAEIVVGADVAMRSCELLVSNTDAATLDTVVFKDSVVVRDGRRMRVGRWTIGGERRRS